MAAAAVFIVVVCHCVISSKPKMKMVTTKLLTFDFYPCVQLHASHFSFLFSLLFIYLCALSFVVYWFACKHVSYSSFQRLLNSGLTNWEQWCCSDSC